MQSWVGWPMKTAPRITQQHAEARTIAAFLEDRLHEFNEQATGHYDGADFCFTIAGDDGAIIAGVGGDTWGGCCVIRQLWVGEAHRGRGYGRALLQAAEEEARRRRCARVVVSTRSFQAPALYERLGYREVARIDGQPEGHVLLFFVKALAAESGQ